MSHHPHEEFRFSVTLHTDDLALLHCLRALCHYCESSAHKATGTAGAKQSDWDEHGHRVVLRFSTHGCRTMFVDQVERLVSRDLWKLVAQSDHDAVPTRATPPAPAGPTATLPRRTTPGTGSRA